MPTSHNFARAYIEGRPEISETPTHVDVMPSSEEVSKFAATELSALERIHHYNVKKWITQARWDSLYRIQQLKLMEMAKSIYSAAVWLDELNCSMRCKPAPGPSETLRPAVAEPVIVERQDLKSPTQVRSVVGAGSAAPDLTKPVNKRDHYYEGPAQAQTTAIEVMDFYAPWPAVAPVAEEPSPPAGLAAGRGNTVEQPAVAAIAPAVAASNEAPLTVTQAVTPAADITPWQPADPKPAGVKKPRVRAAVVVHYDRETSVRSWVLRAAKGRCECCRKKAPFRTAEGPYLEVHHVREIANGGSDTPSNTVAICPNCHRELHFGVDREDVKIRLYSTVSRLVRE